jgi:hypothetical protein
MTKPQPRLSQAEAFRLQALSDLKAASCLMSNALPAQAMSCLQHSAEKMLKAIYLLLAARDEASHSASTPLFTHRLVLLAGVVQLSPGSGVTAGGQAIQDLHRLLKRPPVLEVLQESDRLLPPPKSASQSAPNSEYPWKVELGWTYPGSSARPGEETHRVLAKTFFRLRPLIKHWNQAYRRISG